MSDTDKAEAYALVEEVRDTYDLQRELDEDEAPEDRRSEHARDKHVADQLGVSVEFVRRAVIGETFPDAPGPIDAARRRRLDLYREEVGTLGESEARRRSQLRARGIDPDPKTPRVVQVVRILDPKGRPTGMEYTLEPGHSISVSLGTEGGDR